MEKEKDLCKSCKHYWIDFPLPLDHCEAHCMIVDTKMPRVKMDEVVEYPCIKCPFGEYSEKEGIS